MEPPTTSSKVQVEPAVARWELWTVAHMLISTHGDDAEAHAQAKLAEAEAEKDEASEIVWTGVVTQLKRIRESR